MKAKIMGLLVVGLLAGASAHAQSVEGDAPEAESMRVVIDPDTGKLRLPSADEIKASNEKAAAARAGSKDKSTPAAEPLVKAYANGARRARLTDEFLSHSVAVIRPDGTLETDCLESKDAALNALRSAQLPKAAPSLELE